MLHARAMLALLSLATLVACASSEPARIEAPSFPPQDLIARGAYVARAANCLTCHTAPGSEPYAGGRPFATPFGVVHSSNITPDGETGIGNWTEEEFIAAVRRGVRKDGALLYPVMPTESYVHMTDTDARALWAYVRTLKPVRNAEPEHNLAFPINLRASLRAWRALFFRPTLYGPRDDKDPIWNRGAYLVEGLGHCGSCHSPRNRMGGIDQRRRLRGGTLEEGAAPDITGGPSSSTADWSIGRLALFLRTGEAEGAVAGGPMAEVVRDGTSHLTAEDAHAIAVYLKDLPPYDDDARRAKNR